MKAGDMTDGIFPIHIVDAFRKSRRWLSIGKRWIA